MHNTGMKAALAVSAQILVLIRAERWAAGTHLAAQGLADRLRVSRQPVNEALRFLEENGVAQRERNRGYFLARDYTLLPSELLQEGGAGEGDLTAAAYFRVAEDRLRGDIPECVSETLMRERYGLTRAQLHAVLNRIAREGWIERKPGYGWTFAAMLTTSDSLLQSYRLRLALEPAALLEPGYHLDPAVLASCRAAEVQLLEGGINTARPDSLHERGVNFHESLVGASGNAFFIDTIRRVNRIRRLLSYRSMQDRTRYQEHCRQHLLILDLLERGRNEEASEAVRQHLASTLRNHEHISGILQPDASRRSPLSRRRVGV